jgi:hypothetical protein
MLFQIKFFFYWHFNIIYIIIYVAVFLVSQFASYHYADRSLSFWKVPDNSVYSKGGLAIHIVNVICSSACCSIPRFYWVRIVSVSHHRVCSTRRQKWDDNSTNSTC